MITRWFRGANALAQMATAVRTMGATVPVALTASLSKIGRVVRDHAIEKVGVYQPSVGPYPNWTRLAPATMERKESRGQVGRYDDYDDPLVATGRFRRGIRYEVDRLEGAVAIGTNEEYIIHTEFGTTTMPPRPVFGPAVLEKEAEIEQILAEAVTGGAAAAAGLAEFKR